MTLGVGGTSASGTFGESGRGGLVVIRLSRLGLLPVFIVARPSDVVLSPGVLDRVGVIGVSPTALGDNAVGIESLLAVLWNEAESESDRPLGFERFKLSTGGKRGDDIGSLFGERWTRCIE